MMSQLPSNSSLDGVGDYYLKSLCNASYSGT